MDSAVSRASIESGIMASVADEAMKTLKRPLWEQFAMVAKGRTIEDGRDACRKLMEWFDQVEQTQEGTPGG